EPGTVRRLGDRARAVATHRFGLPRLVDELETCLRGLAVERVVRAELFPRARPHPATPLALTLAKDPR
ncbi:MAG TPA: hypothetical protein VF453_02910, partial [Burkholderiaceae bacterium]